MSKPKSEEAVISNLMKLLQNNDENEEIQKQKNFLIQTISENLQKFVNLDSLYNLDISILGKIIRDSEFDDNLINVSTYSTFIQKTVQQHKDESILLLNYINPNQLSLEELINVLKNFSSSQFCKTIGKKYIEDIASSVNFDADYEIEQKEKEIEELNQQIDKDYSIFGYAKNGNFDKVKYLIESNHFNLQQCDSYGRNLLHIACFTSNYQLAEYVIKKYKETGRDLYKFVNTKTSTGKSPINIVCSNGCFPIVRLLVSNCGDVNDNDPDYNTPLHFASKYGYVSIVEFLLSSGANKYRYNKDNESPYLLAHLKPIKDLLFI